MSDATTTLAQLKERVLGFAKERDWEQFHSPKNLSMALAGEAAELLEHFLWIDSEASRTWTSKSENLVKASEELADVVIYALEFANIVGIDLADAISRKMELNALKYPVSKARGKSLKYDEL